MQNKNHKYNLTNLVLATSLIIAVVVEPASSQSKQIPTDQRSVAVLEVKRPRQGNLLYLRGIAGRGTVTFRMTDGCSAMPVRFVAGDFAGRTSDAAGTGSIRIIVRAPRAVEHLFQGRDLVSDMFSVSDDPTDAVADLQIVKGLSAETGFVINPGRSAAADVFRAQARTVPCQDLEPME